MNNQKLIDVFKGEWVSKFPDSWDVVSGGPIPLFEDNHVGYVKDFFGSLEGFNIVECGSLEGGHTYQLNKEGAFVDAVENNPRFIAKCCLLKEIVNLQFAHFYYDDLFEFMENNGDYDLVFASGVLYHQMNPIRLIELASKVAPRLYIWTHYYDKYLIGKTPFAERYEEEQGFTFDGHGYIGSIHHYDKPENYKIFTGGPDQTSKWLTKGSILDALKNYGYTKIKINYEDLDGANGPSFSICAQKGE